MKQNITRNIQNNTNCDINSCYATLLSLSDKYTNAKKPGPTWHPITGPNS